MCICRKFFILSKFVSRNSYIQTNLNKENLRDLKVFQKIDFIGAESSCFWDTEEVSFFVPNVKPIGDSYFLSAVSDTAFEFSFEVSFLEPNVKVVTVEPAVKFSLSWESELEIWFTVSLFPNLKLTDAGVIAVVVSSLPNVKSGLLDAGVSNVENTDEFDVMPINMTHKQYFTSNTETITHIQIHFKIIQQWHLNY